MVVTLVPMTVMTKFVVIAVTTKLVVTAVTTKLVVQLLRRSWSYQNTFKNLAARWGGLGLGVIIILISVLN